MEENKIIISAVKTIKNAILQSRYIAARAANKEMLNLYFSVGGYISANTRGKEKWGTGAIEEISRQLSAELPGLRGFSAGNIKKMRQFFEEWSEEFCNDTFQTINRQLPTDVNRSLITSDLQMIELQDNTFRQLATAENCSALPNEIETAFLSIGFTHHIEIISRCKDFDERIFYINKTASNFWSVETLRSHIKADDFHKIGSLPNNFAITMPDEQQVSKAVMAFKDEMLLDFINIEEEQDEECIDERVLEHSIVQKIKQFIQKIGTDFCFVDSQHRIIEADEEFFIDLLFYNRSLQSLVAIELKRGKFKPAYLGQLNFYLSLLDKYERHDNENPSIGLLLCKEAKRSIVELAVRDFAKPMGVTTYRLTDNVPNAYKMLKPIVDAADELLK